MKHDGAPLLLLLCVSSLILLIPRRCQAFTARRRHSRTGSPLLSSLSEDSSTSTFPHSSSSSLRPFLAIITESNGCDDDDKLKSTLQAIDAATRTRQVDLISVRIDPEAAKERVEHLVQTLVQLGRAKVVVSSDWIQVGLQAGVHGVHFKETHRHLIPAIRKKNKRLIIGTSAHSIESALEAFESYQPDYFFVGTCYWTESHPDKFDLEGPALPGQVANALKNVVAEQQQQQQQQQQLQEASIQPPVLAIGGIDASNCREPVRYGADGVAVIRAVLAVADPLKAVGNIQENMRSL
jgi:thiamine-phosphate diphosphorylase